MANSGRSTDSFLGMGSFTGPSFGPRRRYEKPSLFKILINPALAELTLPFLDYHLPFSIKSLRASVIDYSQSELVCPWFMSAAIPGAAETKVWRIGISFDRS